MSFIIRSTLKNDIMAAATNSFTDIEEDDETSFDWETITDPKRLKRFRSAGRSILTKTGRRLANAIRTGENRDTVRRIQAVYVHDYEDLDGCHRRFIEFATPHLTQESIVGEKQWIDAVTFSYQHVISSCDEYLKSFSKPSSVTSRRWSQHSSVLSARAKIQEAERKEKEAELKLQQTREEAACRAEEDEALRQVAEYQQRVTNERKERELRDEIELQRLSAAITKQQLMLGLTSKVVGAVTPSSKQSNLQT